MAPFPDKLVGGALDARFVLAVVSPVMLTLMGVSPVLLAVVGALVVAVLVLGVRFGDLRARVTSLESATRALVEHVDKPRRASALKVMAEEVLKFPTDDKGRLSLVHAAQIEVVGKLVDDGADAALVRQAMERIRGGEALVQTLKS